MKTKLLVTAAVGAALTLPALPAAAQHIRPHAVGQGVPNATLPDGRINPAARFDTARRFGHGHRFDHGQRFERGSYDAVGYGYYLQSSYDDRDWAPNTGNDWWNSRPDRAYPRWVQEQHGQACAPERMWWSGSGWHC